MALGLWSSQMRSTLVGRHHAGDGLGRGVAVVGRLDELRVHAQRRIVDEHPPSTLARSIRRSDPRTNASSAPTVAIQTDVSREVVAAPLSAAGTRAAPHAGGPRAVRRYPYVLAGCAPGRLVRIIEGAHGEENSVKALQELNKPLELHVRDTLDWDPLAELCPGST
jgi:hypothetical protein